MPSVVADTHAVIWHFLRFPDLSETGREALRAASTPGHSIFVASVSLVEMTYLGERGRVSSVAYERLIRALMAPDRSRVQLVPLDLEIAQAVRRIPRDIVPDMPDRIIAATALHLGLPLVTKDARIRSLPLETIW
jgi:PIN domain nuclease of toxin-antitoxin system